MDQLFGPSLAPEGDELVLIQLGYAANTGFLPELGPSRFFSVQVKSQVNISSFQSSHKSMDHCIAKSQVLDLIFELLIK